MGNPRCHHHLLGQGARGAHNPLRKQPCGREQRRAASVRFLFPLGMLYENFSRLTLYTSACRKRRIKCDEGKPTCGNCIKSKRQCDGYNQRLTFKEPLGSFAPGNSTYYHQQSQDALIAAQLTSSQARASTSQGQLPIIAPRPPLVDFTGNVPIPFNTDYQEAPRSSISTTHSLSPTLYSPPGVHPTVFSPDSAVPHPISHGLQLPLIHGVHDELPPASSAHANQVPVVLDRAAALHGTHRPSVPPRPGQKLISPAGNTSRVESLASPGEGYWQSDDDASMADSEDEVDQERNLLHLEQNDLGIQVAQHLVAPPRNDGVSMRTFAGNVDHNILQTYTPSSSSSPLNDPQTAAVFWHFVNVTGRMMSLYERNPVDPGPMFQGRPIPRARQSIWTCMCRNCLVCLEVSDDLYQMYSQSYPLITLP